MDKAKRKAIIAGNWKMNKTASEAAVLVDELVPAVQDAGCEVVICTPYTDLVTAVEKTKGTNIHVGAENVHFEKSGAFTGEISADMLVDLRSYERQGLDIIPTVHEGAAVRQMEKRGIQTNIGNLNREIKAANSLMKSIRQLIKNLKGWIIELSEKRKELLAEKAAEEAVFLPNLLMKYMEVRKAERSDWTRAGQNRGTSKDLKAVSEALSYLQRKGLSTVEDFSNGSLRPFWQ